MPDSVISTVAITLLIALAGLGVWIARQSLGLGGIPLFQSRPKRTGLVESSMIDGRRRLLLVRRDNVEHLILTGGPIDLVVETGIKPVPAANSAASDALGQGDNGAGEDRPVMTSSDVPLILHRDQTS